MSLGPNLDLHSVFTNVLRAKDVKMWKYRGTWALETSRHTPTALGTSGALGVGWDIPRSIKIGHAHAGIILWPPGRCFMRQCMFTWAKFRLPSTGSLKNKTRVVGEGKEVVLAWGGGTYGVFFAHARPTLAVLWTFSLTFPEDTLFFAKYGDEVSMG